MTKSRYLLKLGQLLDRLPEDDSPGDMDVEGTDQPALGDLHTIIHLRLAFDFFDPEEMQVQQGPLQRHAPMHVRQLLNVL